MASHSEAVSQLNKILAKIDQQIYKFAMETYNELRFSQVQGALFDRVRSAVDVELAGTTGDTLKLIDGISERLGSGESVAFSQAMTTCRQLIEAVADHVFAPTKEPYTLSTGATIEVTQDKVKNRLNAHVDRCGVRGGRAERIGKSLNGLYARLSTSVHRSEAIDSHEAQYLFLATYLLVGEVVTLSATPQVTDSNQESVKASFPRGPGSVDAEKG